METTSSSINGEHVAQFPTWGFMDIDDFPAPPENYTNYAPPSFSLARRLFPCTISFKLFTGFKALFGFLWIVLSQNVSFEISTPF